MRRASSGSAADLHSVLAAVPLGELSLDVREGASIAVDGQENGGRRHAGLSVTSPMEAR